jgi:hypothetical protein
VAERALTTGTSGEWSTCVEAVEGLIGEVAWRTKEIARIITDVSEGDLSHKMVLEYDGQPLQGDALRVGTAVNQLVDRLRLVSSR